MIRRKRELKMGLVVLVFCAEILCAGLATAADSQSLNDRANLAASRSLGIPLGMVEACRKTGFPLYFSMFQCVIAQESGIPISEVNAARLDGYSWGEMCQAWGVPLDLVKSRVRGAFSAMVNGGVPFPADTREENKRTVATGKRERALRGKP